MKFAVRARTMDGARVDLEALSGGAREQLVCARLAFASLVAKGEGLVPVIIDDALGYTDDDRMENFDRVFNAAKSRCQMVIAAAGSAGIRGLPAAALSACWTSDLAQRLTTPPR